MTKPSRRTTPPKLAGWLVKCFFLSDEKQTILGDIDEQFYWIASESGSFRASVWYWQQSLRTVSKLSVYSVYWSFAMLRNYVIIMFRNIFRQKLFSLINLFGLATGMACSMLILLFIQDDLKYDRYNLKSDRLYRIVNNEKAHVGVPWAPAIQNEIPEVEHAVRILDSAGGPTKLISYNGKSFVEERFFYGDQDIFKVFTWPFVQGDSSTALQDPFSLVISSTMASKYFGSEDALGKIVGVDDRYEFKITGVVRDIPEQSHIRFNFLASMATVFSLDAAGEWGTPMPWNNRFVDTYLLLDQRNDAAAVERRFPRILRSHLGPDYRGNIDIEGTRLQKVTDIHLNSGVTDDFDPQSSTTYIYLLAFISFLILCIACINFMNLSTARSQTRAREAGIRKVLGAFRGQLIRQFLGESLFMSLLALSIAIFLLIWLLPEFSALTGKRMGIDSLENLPIIIGFLGVALFVGIMSGSYPAFFISAFRPVTMLKSQKDPASRGLWLRRGLVVFQFATSTVLVIGTTVVYKQLDFVRTKDLGFNKDKVIVMPFQGSQTLRERTELFKSQVLKNPNIMKASASHSLPGKWLNGFFYLPEGKSRDERVSLGDLVVDHDFSTVYGLRVVAGRPFSGDLVTDSAAFVINESAAKALGWEPAEAVGKRMRWLMGNEPIGTVIGVVEDFHFRSLHTRIPPMVMHITDWSKSFLSVRIQGSNIAATIDFLKETWESLEPSYPFQYYFLDEDFARKYLAEERLGWIFGYFAGLAIFIGCLGLFGLAAFTANQRTKEIGLRKVMGATVPNLIIHLSRDFAKLILVAFLIASPIAYLIMERWLEGFAYRTGISAGIFLLAGVGTFILAWIAVGYQALKAAMSNPVDSLRNE